MQQSENLSDAAKLPPRLAALLDDPLLSAIRERRTRRISQGSSVESGRSAAAS